MEIWTALLLGLFGSLHCAGMCGPLAAALPVTHARRLSFLLGRLSYNLGRLIAYTALGLIFGSIGKTVALAGLQRWAAIVAGLTVLLALAPKTRSGLRWPALNSVSWLKASFATLLQRRGHTALGMLGFLNGFLPCGLAYAACAGALTTGSISRGMVYMIAFGAGTVPMMLAIGLLGHGLQLTLRLRLQKCIPACLALLGLLLILRGMSLGIPYLSPDLTTTHAAHSCH